MDPALRCDEKRSWHQLKTKSARLFRGPAKKKVCRWSLKCLLDGVIEVGPKPSDFWIWFTFLLEVSSFRVERLTATLWDLGKRIQRSSSKWEKSHGGGFKKDLTETNTEFEYAQDFLQLFENLQAPTSILMVVDGQRLQRQWAYNLGIQFHKTTTSFSSLLTDLLYRFVHVLISLVTTRRSISKMLYLFSLVGNWTYHP